MRRSRLWRELRRQLAAHGRARVWVPAERAPGGDLACRRRPALGPRELPTVIVAGVDEAATAAAIEALVAGPRSGSWPSSNRPRSTARPGIVEDYTVAVLNRGLPGFKVEPDGSLYLSLMRACSGWPSGVWIDPPRRTVPDGSNFQFQHWSHRFDYAARRRPGRLASGGIVQSGHEFNNPLIARVLDAHAGDLPADGEPPRGRAQQRRS